MVSAPILPAAPGTAESLLEIRRKLLDLSRRNTLLNYRHPRGKSLRIVDEIPDQLFERLLDGDGFVFESLPRVPLAHESMRDDVREFLQLQDNWRPPSRNEWARMHDIEPDFELPIESAGERRHADLVIQTLLFPDELETRLRNMASQARTAIEESGTNILYLAIGFLEWYEADYSDTKSLAPLVIVPVTLHKAKERDSLRRERFEIRYSGEDLQSNVSLRERLRIDFHQELPELKDDDTPEKYFIRCEELLGNHPNWTIHRFVTLGFFQFGKLLMYLDLDPERWPEGLPISQRPLIEHILEGGSDSGIGGGASIDIDELALDAPEALLIETADSSQHKAIVDGTGSRNIVIEGPPGTGKSQTITNIIGVSLAQGKSVLFVAEKLAALEVVKSRLENADLGDFCLELHSHKTQKHRFLSDLKKRIELSRNALRKSVVTDLRPAYENTRAAIADYLRAVDKRVDGYSMNRQRLFCEVARIGSDIPEKFLTSLNFDEGTERLNESKRDEAIGCSERVELARNKVEAEFQQLNNHPWYGFIPKQAEIASVQGLGALEEWLNIVDSLIRQMYGPHSAEQIRELHTFGQLSRALEAFALLDRSVCQRFSVLKITSLESPTVRIAEWIDQETRLLRSTAQAQSTWKLESSSLQVVRSEVAEATQLLDEEELALSKYTANEVAEIARILEALTDELEEVAQGISSIQEILGCPIAHGKDGIQTARQVLDLGARRPIKSLWVRKPSLEMVRNLERIRELSTTHRRISKAREKLSLQFKIDDKINRNRLEVVESALAETSGLYFFQPAWRNANAVYQSLRFKKTSLRSTKKRAADVRAILDYLEEKTNYERNSAYASMLGPLFSGLETPVDDIWQVCSWFEKIQNALVSDQTDAGITRQKIMRLDDQGFVGLDYLADSPFVSACDLVADLFVQLEKLSPRIGRHLFAGGWANLRARTEGLRDRVVRASNQIALHIDDPSCSIEQGKELLDVAAALRNDQGRSTLHEEYLLQPNQDTWGEDDIARLEALAKAAALFEKEPPDSPVLRACVEHASSAPDAHEKTNEVARTFKEFINARRQVDEIFLVNERQVFGSLIDCLKPAEIQERLKVAAGADMNQVAMWTSLSSAIEAVRRITYVPQVLQDVVFDASQKAGLFWKTIQYFTLGQVADYELCQDPILRDFSGDSHDALLKRFRVLDNRLHRLCSQDISHRLLSKWVPPGQTGRRVGDLTELALLTHEIQKSKRHLPIRRLVKRAGSALLALKPCFMMGPLSVAQYLPPGELDFDLVIMDEASQMRPEDALGAIARGKQLIVVGDPKQLPPTDFFKKLNESEEYEDEDEELIFGDQESILDIAAPSFGRTHALTWHYRSRHENLIAFSNHSFYDNRLLLFPTAHAAASHLGIHYNRVDGTYSNQTNEEEAQALISDVIHEIKSQRDSSRSIGIVAINLQQAQVLRDNWDRAIRELPEIEAKLHDDGEEGVLQNLFIKNLENVQGDERDVIFISLTYGKDRNGNFYQRFGPINRENGWRRLNVLFTRARQQMRIYSSMDSEMIAPGENAKPGVTALKSFLSYCETGILPETPKSTGRGPDSPFEEDIASEVRAFELEAEYQVGVAGFFVDIGVFDPREPGHYLLGIECDGATYHCTQSARDRDKIRQEILESLGWEIYRIWSTDWFNKRAVEREKLRHRLSACKVRADKRAESAASKEETEEPEFASRIGFSASDQPEELQTVPNRSHIPSTENLKSRLLDLRSTLQEEFPDVPAEKSLLNDDVINVLLRRRPTSLERFHQVLPLELRQKIDTKQSSAYLSTVLLMLEDS